MEGRSIADLLVEQKILTPARLEDYLHREAETGRSLTRLLLEDGVIGRRDLMRLAIQVNSRRELPDILREEGWVTPDQLKAVIAGRGGERRGIGHYLVEKGIITEEQLMRASAKLYDLPFTDLSDLRPDMELISSIGQELLEKYRFVPISRQGDQLTVALADPGNVILLEELQRVTGSHIEPRVTTLSAIQLFLSTHFESRVRLDDMTREMVRVDGAGTETGRAARLSVESLAAEDSPVVRMIHSILYNAIERRSSDIHVEVYDREVKVKYRIDGVLFETLSDIDRSFAEHIITRIKIMARLDIAERRVPQDGRFELRVDDRTVDFRVSILPTIFGESAVIRILDRIGLALDVGSLGFQADGMRRFMDCIRRPHGMILVAGPTGSGKTTTLYSALKAIQRKEEKIITIEDPVEYQLADVTQVPVNEKKGLTFARGLRSIVRQDPDIIMVGEIRDLETAQIAINAALTGHLVLSTIHSNQVIDALTRLLNLGVEAHQFTSSFNLVMAQRLVRKVCNACRREEVSDHPVFKGEVIQRGTGCRVCGNSGFFGRTALFELLEMTDEFRELILERQSPLYIKKRMQERGILFLRDEAVAKVRAGLTTPEEIDRVTHEERNG